MGGEGASTARVRPCRSCAELNVAGAYAFLYPFVGIKRTEHHLCLAYSTRLADLQAHGFEPFGCYRNRMVARAGFDALANVFSWIGHQERGADRIPMSPSRRYRQIPDTLDAGIRALLLGDSRDVLADVMMLLIDRPAARRAAEDVQTNLNTLRLFFEHEGERLRRLRGIAGVDRIEQLHRDALDIRAGFGDDESD